MEVSLSAQRKEVFLKGSPADTIGKQEDPLQELKY